jgi:hypothetical protein
MNDRYKHQPHKIDKTEVCVYVCVCVCVMGMRKLKGLAQVPLPNTLPDWQRATTLTGNTNSKSGMGTGGRQH